MKHSAVSAGVYNNAITALTIVKTVIYGCDWM